MPPRYQSRPTDLLTRLRNEMDALGRPGMAGLSRLGGNRGRGFGQASVVADGTQENDEGTDGAAHLLVMSATADSIASGGDYVEFDTIVAQHGFDGVAQPSGGYWVHPVSGVYVLNYEHEWATYEAGGTVRLDLDGVLVPEGVILEGASGQGGQGTILYVAEVGSVGRVHVAHGGASAQTFDATVRIALPDPSIDAVASDPDWSRVFSGDIWGAMFDGTYWWTTSAADATVAKRDALGVSLSSFSAMLAKARGITFDGTYIWVAGDDTPNGNEEIGKYQTDGTHVSTLVTGPSSEGNDGIAWDGSHLWLIEGGSSKAEKYTTAGSLVSSFSLPGSGWQGVAVYDGDLFIVNRTAAALSRYTPAGALVDTIDISGAGAAPTGVWIAADGTLYIAVDGDGLHQRDTKIGA